MEKSKGLIKAQEAKEIKDGLMLNPRQSPISSKQLLHILQKTPKENTYTRKGKGYQEFTYVTGVYMKKVLNYVFGWMWDFEVIEHGEKQKQVWVLGKLTIHTKKGDIIKTQFGRADIKFFKSRPEDMVDFGNDLKAATTDALKKCASELGIASDIYGSNEFKEVSKQETKEQGFETAKNMIKATINTDILFSFMENLKTSKKYTKVQKKELNGLISKKIDELGK